MFVSSLSRILMVLTVLAFAAAFAFVEERSGTIRNAMIGTSLTLLSVTIARLVTEGSAFDDRAFHRTRPGGERMALRRINRYLVGIVIAIAAIAVVRGCIYHLGWQSSLWAAVIALVPVASFTMAIAAAMGVLVQRKSSVRSVILILLAGPIGLALVTMIVPYTGRWISSIISANQMSMVYGWESTPAWMSAPTWASALGVAGYGTAWWLSSRRRLGKAALLLAGLTGMLIQFRATKSPLLPTPDLPPSTTRIERLPAAANPRPVAESLRPRFGDEWGMKQPKVEGSLRAPDLQENEFVDFDLQFSHLEKRFPPYSLALDRGGSAELFKQEEGFVMLSKLDSLLGYMAGTLPGQPLLERRLGRSETFGGSINDPASQIQPATSTWMIQGMLRRADSLGSFPVAARTARQLNGGGKVLTWDLRHTTHEISLGFRVIQPDPPFAPSLKVEPIDGMLRFSPNFVWGVMVNESATKAIVVLDGRHYLIDRQRAFGSYWADFWLNLYSAGSPTDWTAEEVLRSKIHLFISRPLAKVQASLPPP